MRNALQHFPEYERHPPVTENHAYMLSADVTATSRASERLSARQAARELGLDLAVAGA